MLPPADPDYKIIDGPFKSEQPHKKIRKMTEIILHDYSDKKNELV